jgi:phosphohistidine phosphatase SixA
VRARQTAEIVADELDARVVVDPRLGGGLDLSTLSEVLLAHADGERPCVVGHDPDFSELLGELLGIPLLPMRKGAIARVDVGGRNLVAGRGQLRWLLPPEVVGGK